MDIIKCVPNFSEGRRPEVVEAIVEAVRSAPEVVVVDYSMDADHHRSVVTFLGTRGGVGEAVMRAADRAVALINMEHHCGEHPRIGAMDVVPVVPLGATTMRECVELTWCLGEKLAARFQLPIYFYEESARRPERRDLADVRRGQYEGLRTFIQTPEGRPDVGPPCLHPTAGATAMGARGPLIAFNINLDTDDIEVARTIASSIRTRNGGVPGVKAVGIALQSRGIAQVSMNLVRPDQTSMICAFRKVRELADASGVQIAESELIGTLSTYHCSEAERREMKLLQFCDSRLDEPWIEKLQAAVCRPQSAISSLKSEISP